MFRQIISVFLVSLITFGVVTANASPGKICLPKWWCAPMFEPKS